MQAHVSTAFKSYTTHNNDCLNRDVNLSLVSPAESQKGVIAIQRCSAENHKGAIAVQSL